MEKTQALKDLLSQDSVLLDRLEQAVQLELREITETPGFEAGLMLETVFGVSRTDILLGRTGSLDDGRREQLLTLVQGRKERRPLQYLLGSWEFYGRPFIVGEGVLIPRPDTEILAEQVLAGLEHVKAPRVLELCGGSGCLAVTVALERPDAEVWCVEKSEAAFSYLKRNNDALGAGVHILLGDALDTGCVEGDFDCILSNPPYLSDSDMRELEPEVRCEPAMALYGDADGLFFYRELTARWADRLRSGGLLAYEIGMGQQSQVAAIMQAAGLNTICQTMDYGGIIRVLTARA